MARVGDPPACFDGVARIYRAMEYLSFGTMLERCRLSHLGEVADARHALVLGDGDGRFAAKLLAANAQLRADAVDASPAMLRLLAARAARAAAGDRITTVCADARTLKPGADDYDLVVTHFFLDCLSAAEAGAMIAGIRPHLADHARWLVSEFQVCGDGPMRKWLSRHIISALYAAFGLLTGLAVREIPPWGELLASAGFVRTGSRTSLGGLLVSELWELRRTTARTAEPSHQNVRSSSEIAITTSPIPGIDPGPEPFPAPPPVPEPVPAPGPKPEPDPQPYPGPIPAPQPVTRGEGDGIAPASAKPWELAAS